MLSHGRGSYMVFYCRWKVVTSQDKLINSKNAFAREEVHTVCQRPPEKGR